MIIATRIPELSEQMRLGTIRAAAPGTAGSHGRRLTDDEHLIAELERRGYRVTRLERAA